MQEVKVSPKGQVVIPKGLRDKFEIKEGDKVIVEDSERGVLIMKKPRKPAREMVGLFEGETKPSIELLRELRKDWDKRIQRMSKE